MINKKVKNKVSLKNGAIEIDLNEIVSWSINDCNYEIIIELENFNLIILKFGNSNEHSEAIHTINAKW